MTSGRSAVVPMAGLIVVLVLVAPFAAAAQSDDESAQITARGWWTRRPNPSVPAGGFEIAKEVDGPSSVAAVRIALGAGAVTQAVLVLKEAGGLRLDAAVIRGCATPVTWTPVEGGDLAEAPTSDCAKEVKLERDATTGTWKADILPLVSGARGTISVLLSPAAGDASLPVDPGFQAIFTDAQLLAESRADADDDGGTSEAGGTSSGSGTVASGSSPSSSSSGTTIANDFVASVVTSAATSLAGESGAASATVPVEPPPTTAAVDTGAAFDQELEPVSLAQAARTPAPWGRLWALLPVAAGAGAAAAVARKRVRDSAVG